MIVTAGSLWVGCGSTGIPRPSSSTVTVVRSAERVTATVVAWPFMASSTELSTISARRWW